MKEVTYKTRVNFPNLLASPNNIAIKTAIEATERENLDCNQSLLNQISARNEANTQIEANFIIIISGEGYMFTAFTFTAYQVG